MRKTLPSLCTIAVLNAAGSTAFACSSEGGKYDTNPKHEFVVHAEVEYFERVVKIDRFCFELKYNVKEVFLGSFAGPVDTSTCVPIADYHPPEESEIELEKTWMGFERGAEVIVGFTTDPPLKGTELLAQEPGHLRYLAPSCWGALMYRIDKLGDAERSKTIEEWRKMVNYPHWVQQ